MITEARRCGLKFKSDYTNDPTNFDVMRADPDTFKNAISKRDKDGRLYDPRKGLGGYYRYGPRSWCRPSIPRSRNGKTTRSRSSAPRFTRAFSGASKTMRRPTRRLGFRPVYDVVKDDGEIVSPDKYSIAPATEPFETRKAAVQRALAQEHVWNWVWLRRIVYFSTVGATLWLVLFPLLSGAQEADEFNSRIRWVSDLVRFAGGFLPDAASTWIDGYARAPAAFSALVILVIVLLSLGTRIAGRTSNLMASIWQKTPDAPTGLPHENWIYDLRSSPRYIRFHERMKKKIAPAFFAVVFVYLAFALASHLSFDVWDVAGYTCVPTTPTPVPLAVGKTSKPIEFKDVGSVQGDGHHSRGPRRGIFCNHSSESAGTMVRRCHQNRLFRSGAFPQKSRRCGTSAFISRYSCRCGGSSSTIGSRSCCATATLAARNHFTFQIPTTIRSVSPSNLRAAANCSSSSMTP